MRWCARCRDPQVRARRGLRRPLELPRWLEDERRVFSFDPELQAVPGCPAFRGVRLYRDALSPAEASGLLRVLDAAPWIPSQSGKLKQHVGPRFNFLRQRMNAERFTGLPGWAHALEARLRACVDADAREDLALARCRAALAGYATTDVFALRYRAEWAANLDLHVDDAYAYGEVILDVSLDTDSVLTFVGPLRAADEQTACVRVPLPARSIAVLYGSARTDWTHGILAPDIRGVRTSLTLRTLALALRDTEAGRRVLELAGRGANTPDTRLP